MISSWQRKSLKIYLYTAKKSEKLNNTQHKSYKFNSQHNNNCRHCPEANLASPKQYSLNELPSRKSPQTLLATPTTTNGNLVSPLNEFMAANYGNTLIKDNNTSETYYQEDDQTFTIAPIEQIYNLLGKKKEGFRIPKSLLPGRNYSFTRICTTYPKFKIWNHSFAQST